LIQLSLPTVAGMAGYSFSVFKNNHWCPVKYFAKADKRLAINRIAGAPPKKRFELKTAGMG
jgi:hypothetical protein